MNAPIAHFKANDTLEGFRVMQELGQGAASIVYLVQDPKSKQIWAVKHVHREGAKDDRFLQQAIFESEVAQSLDHPNIRKIVKCIKKKHLLISLTDVFLVMEMLDGISMDRRPPTNLDDALTIFFQTAEAMQHMHSRGFVHADMKPNNVLMTKDANGNPCAKIIDLGQSCRTGTIKPRIQGTPDYIAPEQVHRRPIMPKTDVYNLGATMYWTLTARNIPTAMPKGDSLVSKLDDHMIERPRPVIELNPQIPQRLSDLIMQCVEVDQDARPEMSQVIDRLHLIHGLVRAKRNDASGSGMGKPAGGSVAGFVPTKGGSTVAGIRVTDAPPGPDSPAR